MLGYILAGGMRPQVMTTVIASELDNNNSYGELSLRS